MALALFWALSRPAEEGIVGILFIGLGLVATASGLWLRRTEWIGHAASDVSRQATLSSILIVYGLASLTTSLYVVAAVGFACVAVWFNPVLAPDEDTQALRVWPVMRESALLGGVLIVLLILYNGRGVLPFR
jgi:formate/nitrite transporter FocA (FNT family)